MTEIFYTVSAYLFAVMHIHVKDTNVVCDDASLHNKIVSVKTRNMHLGFFLTIKEMRIEVFERAELWAPALASNS